MITLIDEKPVLVSKDDRKLDVLVLLLQKTSMSFLKHFSTVRKLASTWGVTVLRVAAARTRTNAVNMFNIWSSSIKDE